jgi:hypothetical protein
MKARVPGREGQREASFEVVIVRVGCREEKRPCQLLREEPRVEVHVKASTLVSHQDVGRLYIGCLECGAQQVHDRRPGLRPARRGTGADAETVVDEHGARLS